MSMRKKLVIGLGNPGPEFQNTYHNVGMLAARAIAGDLPWKTHRKLFSFATAEDGTTFVIPLVYMNESGKAVREAVKKFKSAPSDIIVIHDESDLPLGTYKISMGRGAAGHKGVQSAMRALGTNGFTRIRIGVRNPSEKRRKKAGAFVLRTISKKDAATLRKVFAAL